MADHGRKLLCLASALLTMVVRSAIAEEGEPSPATPYKLPSVVVTATRLDQPQEHVTQQITVLDSADFNHLPDHNRNIAELLEYQSGQFVNTLSRNDANWGSVGGLGPKYNGYLLDGLPIDSFVDSMSLDPWAFERVEIYKGPASVLYSNYMSMDFAGNQAPLAGTTNWILKDRIDSTSTRVFAGYGSYNTINGRFYHQNRLGDFNYFVGANYEQSDYTNYGTSDSWLHILDNPDYQKTKLYGKGSYLFGRDDHKISIFAHHTQHTGDVGRPNRDFDNNYDTVNAIYSNQVDDQWNIHVATGYRYYGRRWGEDNYPTNLALREHDGVHQQIFPSDLSIGFKHFGNSLLTVGADGQAVTYKTYSEVSGVKSTGNDAPAYSAGTFVQENLVLDKLVLRAGGRYNYTHQTYDLLAGTTPGVPDKSWDKLLWSVGARYNVSPQLAFFSNGGSSFVAPSAKSVGGTLTAADQGVPGKNGQLPNPGLKSESGIGSDVGVDVWPIETMAVGVRAFFNQVDDAIVDNVVSTNPSQTISVNAGRARSYGVEVNIDQYFAEYLQGFANFTYTATDVSNSVDSDQDSSDVPFVPDYMVNVGLNASLPYAVAASPYLRAVGTYYDSTSKSNRRSFGPYQVMNLRLQKLLVGSDAYAITATLDLNNITDEKYEMPWQFRDPGFNTLGGLECRF